MKMSDLKKVIPIMKACIFESKIMEEYGEIHFLKDSICTFNDECIVQYPCKTNINQEFSVNFSSFEKVFGKLDDDATFTIVNNKLLIKSGRAKIKLVLRPFNLSSIKEKIKSIHPPKHKLKNPYHFNLFHALEICSTAIVPFGSLSQPFNSYLYYKDSCMIGCSMFKAVRKQLKMEDEEIQPFIISGDSATVLTKTWSALEDFSELSIKYEIDKNSLCFNFYDIIFISISNSYGIVKYPIEKINDLFSIGGEKITYPNRQLLLGIIERISLFPKEFEDTTERVFQEFDEKGIKFFSKNSIGSIKERCHLKQKISNGCFSFQYKDFKIILDKFLTDDKTPVLVKLYDEKGSSSFIFGDDKCKYIISATKEELA
mgnify:CR=1 FL=1